MRAPRSTIARHINIRPSAAAVTSIENAAASTSRAAQWAAYTNLSGVEWKYKLRAKVPSARGSPDAISHLLEARCVNVSSACFEAEQIILHGEHAQNDLSRLAERFLNHTTNAPQTVYTRLRGLMRPTALVADPTLHEYSYLPLAVGAVHALASASKESWLWTHRPLPTPTFEVTEEPVLAFFSTWVDSAGETWTRSLPFIHEVARQSRGGKLRRLVPAMLPDYLRPLFEPFADSIEPLALWPSDDDPMKPRTWLSNQLFNLRVTRDRFNRYRLQSQQMFASREHGRCFKRALVCDLFSGKEPGRRGPMATQLVKPWLTMQAILAYHGLQSDSHAHLQRLRACDVPGRSSAPPIPHARPECPLRVIFEHRVQRRLLNLDGLLDACNRWSPRTPAGGASVAVQCEVRSFYGGLSRKNNGRSKPVLLTDADVLVTPHGSGMINALQMHAGASLIEVLPVYTYNCPCTGLAKVLASEPRIRHYQLSTGNSSFSVGRWPRRWPSYHNDLILPWAALRSVLQAVVDG